MIDFIREFISDNGGITGVCDAGRLDDSRYRAFTPFVNADTEKRVNPSAILPSASSVIVAGFGHDALTDIPAAAPALSSLGVNEDYHKKIKGILRALVSILLEQTAFNYKILVDSGTLDERALAVKAGLGFYGRNGLVISREFGSFFNIGLVLTDIPVKTLLGYGTLSERNASSYTYSSAQPAASSASLGLTTADRTGAAAARMSCPPDCRRCVEACPGGAISSGINSGIDVNRCVSYLTQKEGELTEAEARLIGNQLYGCDICRSVCPFNAGVRRKAAPLTDPEEWLGMTDAELTERYKTTAMAWKGAGILKRNACVVKSNL
jgi:epoxyqueuosine reductase